MPDLDQEERTFIAQNARYKLEANKAVNHPDAQVIIQSAITGLDGVETIRIVVVLPARA